LTPPEERPEVFLVWPGGKEVPRPTPVAGYTLQVLTPSRDPWWIEIHRRAVPTFVPADLEAWLQRYRRLALPGGILVAIEDGTGEPVATAGSLADSREGLFPDGGQLGWVATVPEHRGRGLSGWLCALATLRLQEEGFRRIFLSTGEDMPAAIRVYLRLGFVPCLLDMRQRDPWARICRAVGAPFDPERWPTREEYLVS